jgi:hypothetical protein
MRLSVIDTAAGGTVSTFTCLRQRSQGVYIQIYRLLLE